MSGEQGSEKFSVTAVDPDEQTRLLTYFVARFKGLSERFVALPPAEGPARGAIARALYSTYGDCARLAKQESDDGFFRWVLALMAGR